MNSGISITQILAILNSSREALCLLNDKFQLVYCTDPVIEMTGWSYEEWLQVELLNNTHPDDLEILKNAMEEVLSNSNKPISVTYRTLHKNGNYIWIKSVMTNLLEDKNVSGIVSNYEDITLQKELEEKQILYASIVNSSDDIILSKNLDGIITGWNKSAEKEFGYTSSEIIGKHISILIPVDLQYEEVDIMKKISSGQIIDHYETKRVTKSGNIIHVSLTISPILDSNGNIIGASKISRNITVRKKTEESLKKNIKEISDYKYALDEASIVAITDHKGIINYVNDNFCKIAKYTREELIGQNHSIVSSGYHPKEYIKNLWETIENGRVWRGEFKNKSKDGTFYWVDTTIVPFIGDNGKPFQYLSIRANITERKIAEQETLKVNRLYNFLSAINQSIVYIKDEMQLLDKCQKIAVDLGKFLAADIGILNGDGILMSINSDHFKKKVPVLQKFSGKDFSITPLNKTPTGKALYSGLYSISNDVLNNPDLIIWKEELKSKGIRSCASYSIKRFGATIGVFNFYSSEINFFDAKEIALLNEAVNDISFAFESFEKDKLHLMAEKAMERSEANYRSIMQQAGDAILVSDKKGKCLDANPSFLKLTGYSIKDVLSLTIQEFIPESDSVIQKQQLKRLLSGENVITEKILKKKDGGFVLTEMNSNLASDGRLLAIFRDITERKNAEEKLIYVNRMYAFISQINQTIVHTKNENELYERVCHIATEVGKFKAAWIGIINSENKTISLISGSGIRSEELEMFHEIPYENTGMLINVLQSNVSYVCNDVQNQLQSNNWKKFAKLGGYSSAMVLPIRKNEIIVGTFNLYATEIDFFNETEIALLEGAVCDISFALNVFEKKKLHKIAEQKVIDTVERLNQAQKISHVGSWELNFSTGIALLSEELINIYGLNPEDKEQTYDSWFSFIHPEDIDYVKGILEETQLTFSKCSFYSRIIRTDGAIRQVHIQIQFNFDDQGNPIGLSGVQHDVTEIKEAEHKLLESEMFNKGVLSSLSAHIAVVDKTGIVVAVNKAWNDFAKENGSVSLERTSEGSNYFAVCEKALVSGDTIAGEVLEGLKLVFEKKLPFFELEYPCHSPTTKRWFILIAMNFGTDGSKIVISHQDVTERKEMELVLVRSQANIKAIIENTDASIYSLDRDLIYTAFNQKLQSNLKLSYGVDIKIGDSVDKYLDLLAIEDAKEWKEIYKKALNGEMFKFERKFEVNDFTYYIGFSIHPIWEDEAVIGLSCFATDITNQKNAEQKIINSEKHIRNFAGHLNRIQEEERAHLAREIHDELGQQLIGIKIGVSALGDKNNETISDLLKDVDNTIQSVRKIATELRPGILDSLGLIPSIDWLVRGFEKKTGIKCNLFLNVDEQWFEKDLSTCFFRISQEALTNITKHASASEIIFEMNYIDEILTIQITDNGKGMTSEKLENPFSVGLLGMRERARIIGGDLQITSKQNEGTSVLLSVKIK